MNYPFLRPILIILFLGLCSQTLGQGTILLDNCPKSPNCVCTFGEKTRKNMTPLHFKGTLSETINQLKTLILTFKGSNLVNETTNYLHFEFLTKVGKFVDDIEFYLNSETAVIHFRSASRTGYADFGANKRRMKKISKKWRYL